jgi:hypothetical protein
MILGIYPNEFKTMATLEYTFTAASFTVAQSWKHPRGPSGGEWINKLWYIHTVEYYLAIKK